MGLRCTVFGHKWGDADTEREREEDGSEVVATVREVRTCRRCGAEDVLGTSKEVTSLASESEADPHEGERSAPDPEPRDREESYDPETDDGVILDEDGDTGGGREPREWPNHPERDEDADEAGDPAPWPETARETDDESRGERFVGAERQAVDRDEFDRSGGSPSTETDERSLEDPGDRPRAGREERPVSGRDEPGTGGDGGDIIEADDATADDAGDEVGHEAAVGGEDADPDGVADPGEDAHGGEDADETGTQDDVEETPAADPGQRPTDGVDVPSAEPDRQPAEASESTDEGTMMGPDATQRPDDDAELLESTEPNEQTRATAEEPVDPTEHAPATDPEVTPPDPAPSLDPSEPPSDEEPSPADIEYYCPECDYVDDSTWPSRRAGDVCPNCRRSYLSERQH